jgi:dTDP-4-dehydrorhamnose reductase
LKVIAKKYSEYNFRFLSRQEMALDNRDMVRKVVSDFQPHFLINCAAYTQVDKAEEERDEAMRINGKAPGWMAEACDKAGSKMIHISTDYVFNGKATTPQKEDEPVDPVNWYGATKLEGEKRVLEALPHSVIIRTSWVYSSFGKNFVKTMLRLMDEKDSISVVNDQVGSPTYAADLAEAIMQVIQQGIQPGIYHFSNGGTISWYDFAQEIKTASGKTCTVNAIPSSQFPTPATRPSYSVMDTSKISTTYNLPIQPWKESLKACLKKLALKADQ